MITRNNLDRITDWYVDSVNRRRIQMYNASLKSLLDKFTVSPELIAVQYKMPPLLIVDEKI